MEEATLNQRLNKLSRVHLGRWQDQKTGRILQLMYILILCLSSDNFPFPCQSPTDSARQSSNTRRSAGQEDIKYLLWLINN